MLSDIKRNIKKIARVQKSIRNAIKNRDKPLPIYADSDSDGIKVHLGAGTVNIQGWVNVDARDMDHVHLCIDNFDLNEFSDGSISEIYMCHVLEHLSFQEAKDFLDHFMRKLATGGVIRISVPDFNSLVEMYIQSKKDLSRIKKALMGGQDYEYNYHKSVYDEKLLTDLLEECGYTHVERWKTETDFGVDLGDWSNVDIKVGEQLIPMSLNLKGIKVAN